MVKTHKNKTSKEKNILNKKSQNNGENDHEIDAGIIGLQAFKACEENLRSGLCHLHLGQVTVSKP